MYITSYLQKNNKQQYELETENEKLKMEIEQMRKTSKVNIIK